MTEINKRDETIKKAVPGQNRNLKTNPIIKPTTDNMFKINLLLEYNSETLTAFPII